MFMTPWRMLSPKLSPRDSKPGDKRNQHLPVLEQLVVVSFDGAKCTITGIRGDGQMLIRSWDHHGPPKRGEVNLKS